MLGSRKELVVYGTGSLSKKISNILIEQNFHISFYVDSDGSKIGEFFNGREIKSNKVLIEFDKEKQLIIVASSFYSEIKEILTSMGLIEYMDFLDGEIFSISNHFQVSFSQEGEDIILEGIIGKDKGFFIDIGAYHPFRFSNTFKFYQKGWKGINIEPTPNKINLFKLFRPNDINLEIGISKRNEKKEFYIYDENAYNTLDSELVKERIKRSGLNYTYKKVIEFKRLDTLFGELKLEKINIDFMNIDVEGHELEVLHSNDWVVYRPEFLAVEIFDLQVSPVYGFLLEKGYELVAKTPRTAIFRMKNM